MRQLDALEMQDVQRRPINLWTNRLRVENRRHRRNSTLEQIGWLTGHYVWYEVEQYSMASRYHTLLATEERQRLLDRCPAPTRLMKATT